MTNYELANALRSIESRSKRAMLEEENELLRRRLEILEELVLQQARPEELRVRLDKGAYLPQRAHPTDAGMLKSKSGLNVKDGIVSEGVIDEGYTGSITVKLYNHGAEAKQFSRGDKITQLVVLPVLYPRVEQTEEIQGGPRGDNGYGSTGR